MCEVGFGGREDGCDLIQRLPRAVGGAENGFSFGSFGVGSARRGEGATGGACLDERCNVRAKLVWVGVVALS